MIRLVIKKCPDFELDKESMVWIIKEENGKRLFGKVTFEEDKMTNHGLLSNDPSFMIRDDQLEKITEKNPFKILCQEIEHLRQIITDLIKK